MKNKRPVLFKTLRFFAVIAVCLAIFLALTPISLAAQYPAVGVKVTIGPCIRVSPGGTVTSNVSTLTFEDSGIFTVMAR